MRNTLSYKIERRGSSCRIIFRSGTVNGLIIMQLLKKSLAGDLSFKGFNVANTREPRFDLIYEISSEKLREISDSFKNLLGMAREVNLS